VNELGEGAQFGGGIVGEVDDGFGVVHGACVWGGCWVWVVPSETAVPVEAGGVPGGGRHGFMVLGFSVLGSRFSVGENRNGLGGKGIRVEWIWGIVEGKWCRLERIWDSVEWRWNRLERIWDSVERKWCRVGGIWNSVERKWDRLERIWDSVEQN
jgi:hypothetical protein